MLVTNLQELNKHTGLGNQNPKPFKDTSFFVHSFRRERRQKSLLFLTWLTRQTYQEGFLKWILWKQNLRLEFFCEVSVEGDLPGEICKGKGNRIVQEKKAGKDTDGYRCSPGSAGCHKEVLNQGSSLTEARDLGLCSSVNSPWLPEASSSPNLILQCISGEHCSFGLRVTPWSEVQL